MENAEAEIARMEALGLKGVKLHPDMQQFYIDDPKMYPIYELLAGRLPVLFHTGDYRYPYSHPERLARVLDDFPALTAIAAHFGGWSIPEIALDCLRGRRCFFDVSSSLMFLGNRRGEELIRLYDPERMLFGSDFPMWDPAEELERFYTLRLSEEERKMILWENALRVLGEKG
jgi:predicted TIM-barrel fold metal-dependent hydrolase